MSNEKRQIKFLMDRSLDQRMRWAMYCQKLESNQDAMTAAIMLWMETNEETFGPPADPSAKAPQTKPLRRAGGR